MADEPSNAELARRMDRIEVLLQDLSLRLVSSDVYNRDQRETERRFAELERELAEERLARKEDVKDLRGRMDERDKTGGSNFRQGIYSGVIPALLVLAGILVQVFLALRGGR